MDGGEGPLAGAAEQEHCSRESIARVLRRYVCYSLHVRFNRSMPPDHPYGERQYNAEDFCGHRWDFTETIADIAPEEWSGGAFHVE